MCIFISFTKIFITHFKNFKFLLILIFKLLLFLHKFFYNTIFKEINYLRHTIFMKDAQFTVLVYKSDKYTFGSNGFCVLFLISPIQIFSVLNHFDYLT